MEAFREILATQPAAPIAEGYTGLLPMSRGGCIKWGLAKASKSII